MNRGRGQGNRQPFLLDKYPAVSYCNMTHYNRLGTMFGLTIKYNEYLFKISLWR